MEEESECPICGQRYPLRLLNIHANQCIDNMASAPPPPAQPSPPAYPAPSQPPPPSYSAPSQPVVVSPPVSEGPILCPICQKVPSASESFFLPCCHVACSSCLHSLLLEHIKKYTVSKAVCPICSSPFPSFVVSQLLSPSETAQYDRASVIEGMRSCGCDVVECPSCHAILELAHQSLSAAEIAKTVSQFKADASLPRGMSDALLGRAARHYLEFRLRCRTDGCGCDFCAKCGTTPYHVGYTCESWEERKTAAVCRYCGENIPPEKVTVDGCCCCGSDDCEEKLKMACTHILPCGHRCFGTVGEKEGQHPHCMEEKCEEEAQKSGFEGADGDQSGGDFCPICWTDELRSSPCLKLKCGHLIHYDCLLQKIRAGWPGARITFGFLGCPVCKQQISHPLLDNEMRSILTLKKEIEEKAMARLKDTHRENCSEIVSPGSKFYQRPLDYAMHYFSYFMCYKCKKPYFGGVYACGENAGGDFDPKELLCPQCCPFTIQTVCPKHGQEYIEWKCKFCCNVASFFCWGTTHFCEECHKRPGEVTRTPRDKLPKCKCGIKHPPNGEEFCLGCSLCREEKEYFK